MDALVKNKIYYFIHDYLMIVFGTLLYGFGFNAFILSNEIVTGGLSGLCALIFFATNGLIPVSVSYFIINAGLLLLALKVLGLKYLIKTIVGVISLSASFSFFFIGAMYLETVVSYFAWRMRFLIVMRSTCES